MKQPTVHASTNPSCVFLEVLVNVFLQRVHMRLCFFEQTLRRGFWQEKGVAYFFWRRKGVVYFLITQSWMDVFFHTFEFFDTMHAIHLHLLGSGVVLTAS